MRTNLHLINQCVSLTKFGNNMWNFHNQLKYPTPIVQNINICGILHSRNYCDKTIDKKCWNCHKQTKRTNLFFCNLCGTLQDPPNKAINYFNFLSIDKSFSINTTELTKKFRQLQNLVHPDKYGNRIEREQTNSQEWSSILNKAYKTLLTPMERGQYILKLNGYSMPQDNSSLDQFFLMEMMERNEEIAEANENNILELLEKVQNDLKNEAENLSKCFRSDDFEEAKLILVKMKYLKRLEKSIKAKDEKFKDIAWK